MVLFYFNHGTSWETDVFFECAMVNFVFNSWEINNRWSKSWFKKWRKYENRMGVACRPHAGTWESHENCTSTHGSHMENACPTHASQMKIARRQHTHSHSFTVSIFIMLPLASKVQTSQRLQPLSRIFIYGECLAQCSRLCEHGRSHPTPSYNDASTTNSTLHRSILSSRPFAKAKIRYDIQQHQQGCWSKSTSTTTALRNPERRQDRE
jgi:hypothetical protein